MRNTAAFFCQAPVANSSRTSGSVALLRTSDVGPKIRVACSRRRGQHQPLQRLTDVNDLVDLERAIRCAFSRFGVSQAPPKSNIKKSSFWSSLTVKILLSALIVSSFVVVVCCIVSRPDSGLVVRDRKHLFTTYRASFSGLDLVDWLISNMPGKTDS